MYCKAGVAFPKGNFGVRMPTRPHSLMKTVTMEHLFMRNVKFDPNGTAFVIPTIHSIVYLQQPCRRGDLSDYLWGKKLHE
jgi:hypothetical protein